MGLFYMFVHSVLAAHGFSGHVLSFLVTVSLKGTVFLLLASALAIVLRRPSAAARHLVWTLALGTIIALPIASLTLPRWELTVTGSSPTIPAPNTGEAVVVPSSHQLRSYPASELVSGAQDRAAYPGWPGWLLALYIVGLLLLVARITAGEVRVRAIVKHSRLFETTEVKSVFRHACLRMRISRAVEVRTSAQIAIPFTWGVLRPTILLPEEAREWPAKQLELVLVHELAHVSRRDCFTQMLAQAACALYWFHPLVWLAAFQMRKDRERACDDLVLGLGHPATQYAECLLSLGRSLRALDPLRSTGVAMAHPSNLEVRMKALLDAGLNHKPIRIERALAATALAVALLLPAAAVHATAKDVAASRAPARLLTTGKGSNRTASMSGTVRDPSGAVIPGAVVTVLNVETHHRITVTTRGDGTWELPGLPPGRYQVEITKPGFTPSELQGDLRSSRTAHWDDIMQVGQVTQMVTITVRGHKAAENAPAPPHPATPQRIRVGGEIEAARLIYAPKVIYPESAAKQGIAGMVVLQAVIGKNGNILSLSPLSGPDHALIQAAMDAVRQWRYKPTLLNGVPIEVVTTIEVVFQLDNQSASEQEPGDSITR
jgi:TonB family protein